MLGPNQNESKVKNSIYSFIIVTNKDRLADCCSSYMNKYFKTLHLIGEMSLQCVGGSRRVNNCGSSLQCYKKGMENSRRDGYDFVMNAKPYF